MLTIIMFIAFPSQINAKTITASYDGVEIEFEDTPVIENGYTLVPLRVIMETLGLSVEYDKSTKTAYLDNEEYHIEITVGSDVALVNDVKKRVRAPAKIINDKMFIPLRFLSEEMGIGVTWDPNEWRIILDSSGYFVKIDLMDDLLSEYHLYFPEIKNFLYKSSISEEYIIVSENTKDKLEYKIEINTNDMVKKMNNGLTSYLDYLNNMKSKAVFYNSRYEDNIYSDERKIIQTYEYYAKKYTLTMKMETDRYQGGGTFLFVLARDS